MNKIKTVICQGIKFIGLSGIGWLLDMLVFSVLGFFSKDYFVNNLLSSCVGVSFVFFSSTKLIFQNSSKIALRYKYIMYILYQVILILLISKVLVEIDVFVGRMLNLEILYSVKHVIAKIAVTPITMILNFFVMRCLIYKL